ncbi:glycosyltransferase [Tessaracoccus flavus]|uniref:Uncharacterized protein n=1 Tax=Tessaracoccus flavus TaxID=1610493 RepID=A0A1Q2CBL9_9ACTN|nr:glycosyltransferase [Tessaracoccus flavus]AQP43501.1 hypothetical protein RPIT_00610 [Tessaracoccus flavus]SDY85410.1 Glycosyltransferase involved in cell wall bisynthesis [Tessaracoccus flavus]
MTVKAPRIVLFRHAPVDFDSRIKRVARTLQRGGFEPIIISVEPADGESGEFLLGGDIRVIRVPLKVAPAAPKPAAQVAADADKLRRQRKVYAQRVSGLDARSAKSAIKWGLTSGRLASMRGNRFAKALLRRANSAKVALVERNHPFNSLDLAANHPQAYNITHTLTDLLVSLEPDVLHAHNPVALPAAYEAMVRLKARGKTVKLSYDVREDFAGLPDKEIGSRNAFDAVLEMEKRFMPFADYVWTVTESHAELLKKKYNLPVLPDTFVNMSVFQPMVGDITVREAAGLSEDTPLLVYAGIMSWARGMETLIEAMSMVDEAVHLAIVSVPNPHPMKPKLEALAEEFGVLDRIHFVDPVSQAHLSYYLSGADIAVHPLPGGSPNHDRTLPNKLFEYMHAELPLVSSDAKTMAKFVVDNGMGEVFRSEDPVDLARAISLELRNPVSQEHMHALAEKFSWQANEPRIIEAYSRLTGFPGTLADGEFGTTEVTPA